MGIMSSCALAVFRFIAPEEDPRGYTRADFLMAFIPLMAAVSAYIFSPLFPPV